MARKSDATGQRALFPEMDDARKPAKAPLPDLTPTPLPISARPLFLPRLVREAAGHTQMNAYAGREAAHAVGRKWIDDLRAGVIHGLTETQVEQDFTTRLLGALGYTTSADVPTGQPWTMTPKWHVPGVGPADALTRVPDKGAVVVIPAPGRMLCCA